MSRSFQTIPGELVTLELPGGKGRTLDGFWTPAPNRARHTLVFVHGMGSNFYKSRFKKAWMKLGPQNGMNVFCFNNRGFESQVADERFRDCVEDIDAALAFVRSRAPGRITLLGHSTGCQKITYYWHRRRPADVDLLVLAALGDDMAIARRELGRRYMYRVREARRLVAEGHGGTVMPPECLNFTARRFLSAVDPEQLEARLFDLDGEMRIFRKVRIPVLAVFPENEQYACIPVEEAAERLRAATRSVRYESVIIPGADHSFHGVETVCVRKTLRLIGRLLKETGTTPRKPAAASGQRTPGR